jgi:glycosyltransferase involved in cell wall biosynthesis
MTGLRVMEVIARMNVGGPAVIVADLVRGLDPAEFEVQAVCGVVGDGEADYLVVHDPELPVVRLDDLGRSVRALSDVRALVQLVRLMRSVRPDVVHTHTAKAGVLGRVAAVLARVPVRVHTFHGHVLHGYFSPRVTALVRWIERVLAWRTTAIVAVGAQVRDDLVAAGVGRPDQYSVIAPGVHPLRLPERSAARQVLGLPADAPVVLFVGRLTRIKRPDRLIEAMRLVLAEVPDAVLAIAGEGDLSAETKAAAADLGDSVRFLGWRDDLGTVYAAGDVMVLTSDNEGMPVSLIEASLAGLPCVTTGVGSAAEVVVHERTGLVVESTAEAVAAALVSLIRDPQRRAEFGIEAARYAAAQFGPARQVADHAALYRRLVVAQRRSDHR